MSSKPAIAVELVTRSELLELGEVEARYAETTKTLAELEKPLKAARSALVQKVLGLPTGHELKLYTRFK